MRQNFWNRIRDSLRRKKRAGRIRRAPGTSRGFKWWAQAVALSMVWSLAALAALLAWYALDLPDIHAIEGKGRRPSITVLAHDGMPLARFGDYFADQIPVGDLPSALIQAVIAVEDRRFYDHIGIDPRGLLRAGLANLLAGRVVQGGSTITQQLAKNLFLTPARTFRRKVQEMLLALWLEQKYSKNQILGSYLNRVYLGAGAYGVDAAAQTYFHKSARAVNRYEAAMLAGLLKAPTRYAPVNDPEAARERAAVVLSAMIDAGMITAKERQQALAGGEPDRKAAAAPPKADARYFAAWVMGQAAQLADVSGQDLIIQTTLDPQLQRTAERIIGAALKANGRKKNVEQAALLTLAPDGAIRAYVGGYDYNASEFDRVTSARRQPGSAFKPFVYLTALEHGLTANSPVVDAPFSANGYRPENYEGKYYGDTTAREALARSMNTVAVKLLRDTGVDEVRRTARRLGITSPLGRDLSLALGASEVSLYDLTTAYAAIAAGGKAVAPYAITAIQARGGALLYRQPQVESPQMVNTAAAAALTDMLRSVVQFGTGTQAALDRPVAGKTGTTQDYRDAWFVGFSADYVTGVWLGNDDNSPMKRVTGGTLPAKIWHDTMQAAHTGLPPRDLPALTANGWIAGVKAAPVAIADELGGLIGRLLGGGGQD